MKPTLSAILCALLISCAGPVKAPPAVIRLGPVTPIAEPHRAAPRAIPTATPGTPTRATILRDYATADRLTVAYVISAGSTVEGIARARELSAAATRAVYLMRHRGRPSDISNAAAAVGELLNLVR